MSKHDEPHNGHTWRELLGGGKRDSLMAKLRFAEYRRGVKTWPELMEGTNRSKRNADANRIRKAGQFQSTEQNETI